MSLVRAIGPPSFDPRAVCRGRDDGTRWPRAGPARPNVTLLRDSWGCHPATRAGPSGGAYSMWLDGPPRSESHRLSRASHRLLVIATTPSPGQTLIGGERRLCVSVWSRSTARHDPPANAEKKTAPARPPMQHPLFQRTRWAPSPRHQACRFGLSCSRRRLPRNPRQLAPRRRPRQAPSHAVVGTQCLRLTHGAPCLLHSKPSFSLLSCCVSLELIGSYSIYGLAP